MKFVLSLCRSVSNLRFHALGLPNRRPQLNELPDLALNLLFLKGMFSKLNGIILKKDGLRVLSTGLNQFMSNGLPEVRHWNFLCSRFILGRSWQRKKSTAYGYKGRTYYHL